MVHQIYILFSISAFNTHKANSHKSVTVWNLQDYPTDARHEGNYPESQNSPRKPLLKKTFTFWERVYVKTNSKLKCITTKLKGPSVGQNEGDSRISKRMSLNIQNDQATLYIITLVTCPRLFLAALLNKPRSRPRIFSCDPRWLNF